MLNWQIGKKYRRRNGDVSTMIGYYTGHGSAGSSINFDDDNPVWAESGSRSTKWINEYDIIEEVKEKEMKIEVGKYYKTRDALYA